MNYRKLYLCLWVAIAVQWRLQWWGTPCTPPPQKGGEQRCHQMNHSGLAGGYLMYPFDEYGVLRTKSNPKKPDKVSREEMNVCILIVGFLQTKENMISFKHAIIEKRSMSNGNALKGDSQRVS